jgi:hypothetical protein
VALLISRYFWAALFTGGPALLLLRLPSHQSYIYSADQDASLPRTSQTAHQNFGTPCSSKQKYGMLNTACSRNRACHTSNSSHVLCRTSQTPSMSVRSHNERVLALRPRYGVTRSTQRIDCKLSRPLNVLMLFTHGTNAAAKLKSSMHVLVLLVTPGPCWQKLCPGAPAYPQGYPWSKKGSHKKTSRVFRLGVCFQPCCQQEVTRSGPASWQESGANIANHQQPKGINY